MMPILNDHYFSAATYQNKLKLKIINGTLFNHKLSLGLYYISNLMDNADSA